MPGRKGGDPTGYRYGFNTQENDNEITGVTGSHTTAPFWEYDTRLGRRWNVDPKPTIGLSVYSTFVNNPILLNDIKGDTTYNFDDKTGKYLNMTDFNKPGNHGRIISETTTAQVNKDLTITYTTIRKTVNFEFADPINDPKDIQNGVIDRIVRVKELEIKSMLKNAGAFDYFNRVINVFYAWREGKGGGKLDFSYTAIPKAYPGASSYPLNQPSPMLFLVGNVAHNHMNFGNFLYGAAGEALGINIGSLRIGGHVNSIGFPKLNGYDPQLDSNDDQYSIQLGFFYAKFKGYEKH